MNDNRLHANALCQVLRLEGVRPGTEARIEQRVRHLIEHNGPEFAISQLKRLKAHSIENLDKPSPFRHVDGEVSISWNTREDRPTGPLGLLYQQFKRPETRIRVLGSMIEAIQLDTLSQKQTEKFLSGVLSRDKSEHTFYIPDEQLLHVEKTLSFYWRKQDPFCALHLTATSLPYGPYGNVSSKSWKMALADLDKPHPDLSRANLAIAKLDYHTIAQYKTAPRESRTYYNWVRNQLSLGLPLMKGSDHEIKSRPYEGLRRDVWFPEYEPYVGNFAMLQQGGAKLRSICNVNRYVNYTLEPFAKALEKGWYAHPAIAVLDQPSGLAWAQQKLKEGTRLTSMDLTSATDLLDFRALTRALSRLGDRTPILCETVKYFESMAQKPLYSPDLDAGLHFNTGQPLGMAGSFQILTIMNYLAGAAAAKAVGLDPKDSFRVVGDDMICDSRMAQAYAQVIEDLRGKTNAEKALESDRYGEFLSHIVTRDMIYIMKPKYRAGYEAIFTNAEKSTVDRINHVYRVSARHKEALDLFAYYTDYRYSNIPDIVGPRRARLYDRRLMSTALSRIAAYTHGGIPNHLEVTRMTIEYAHRQFPNVLAKDSVLGLELGISAWDRKNPGDKIASRGPIHHDNGRFPTSVDKYDHKTGKRVTIEEVARKMSLKSMTKLFNIMDKLNNDLEKGISSEITLSNGIVINTTDELLGAMDDLQQQGFPVEEELAQLRAQQVERSSRTQIER